MNRNTHEDSLIRTYEAHGSLSTAPEIAEPYDLPRFERDEPYHMAAYSGPFRKPPIHLIGFVGNHQTGKSTAAEMLYDRFMKVKGVRPVKLSFADDLRLHLNQGLPLDLRHPEKTHPLERATLQYGGEAWRRLDRNYWVRRVLNKLANANGVGLGIRVVVGIIDDVYNFNEMPLFNHLVMVRNIHRDDLAEHRAMGYVPETVYSTDFAFRHREVLAAMVDRLTYLEVAHPSGLANEDVVDDLFRASMNMIDDTLKFLGDQPLVFPLQPPLFADSKTQSISKEAHAQTTAPAVPDPGVAALQRSVR